MDLSAVPNLKAWLTRCPARPGAREALALKSKADNETPAEVIRASPRSTGCNVEYSQSGEAPHIHFPLP